MSKQDEMFGICKFRPQCKSQQCSFKCYPFTFLHGTEGKTGVWKTRNVPKKYETCTEENLPPITPPQTRDKMLEYMQKVLAVVEKGIGLFLYSIPTKDNPLGTGTGKTTVACSIINKFTVERSKEAITGGRPLTTTPAMFLEMADFQNVYNAQFRGTRASQEEASEMFYQHKMKMKTVELLVLDDIAMRNVTEAFTNELYEIVNHRVNEGLTTIYTSNEPLNTLSDVLGERIVSRIEGSTHIFPFTGKDHRRKEW